MPGILIVDDNEQEVRRPLVRQLGRVFGPEELLEAENGQEALSVLGDHVGEVGVVVLDIMMPVMDGIEACRAIRATPEFAGLYIIMLTGRDGGLPEGLDVGADVYLRKPCEAEELIAVVKKGLSAFEKHRNLINEQAQLSNLLHRVEEEKFRLQRTSTYMDMPSTGDFQTSWIDIVDES